MCRCFFCIVVIAVVGSIVVVFSGPTRVKAVVALVVVSAAAAVVGAGVVVAGVVVVVADVVVIRGRPSRTPYCDHT